MEFICAKDAVKLCIGPFKEGLALRAPDFREGSGGLLCALCFRYGCFLLTGYCVISLCVGEGCSLLPCFCRPFLRTDCDIVRDILGCGVLIRCCKRQPCGIDIGPCHLCDIPVTGASQSDDLTADCLKTVDVGGHDRLAVHAHDGLEVGVCVALCPDRLDGDVSCDSDRVVVLVETDCDD